MALTTLQILRKLVSHFYEFCRNQEGKPLFNNFAVDLPVSAIALTAHFK